MFQVIAALLGIADGANKGAQAQLAARQAADQSDLNYSRSKILGYYTQDQQQLLLFGGLALILAVIIAIMAFKK